MQASETKLQPLIEGTKQYVVPLFQRSYSWDRKEWEVLWKDLIELYEMENPRTHFMGSIVTMPAVSVPEGVTKFQLIDGQQRLTTIFILLALLRDKAREVGESPLADEINNTLLVNPYKTGTDSYKLLPTQADRASFYALIGHDNHLAGSRITEAYLYFDRKFKQKQPDIRSLNRIISSTLSAVSIVLDADDNPYLVFESLNAKGKPLSQADLIRNYVFMRVHIDEQQAIHEKYWKPMQDALDENLTEYIRHYLMMGGDVVRQNDVYFALKASVGTGVVLDKLRHIAQFAEYYHKMLTPIAESDNDIRSALARLNRIEVTTAYPFVLNCYDDYETARISRDEFLQILAVIENFMTRRFVCNIPTMGLNRMFPALYSQVSQRSGNSFVANLRGVLQGRGYPKDDEFRQRLISAKLYGVGERTTKTRLILETMERSFGHKEQVPFDNLSIEHVMPQTLTEWWQHHLGGEWEMVRELYLHAIGNLTLTAYNPELSNDDYPTKRKRLGKSHLELNRYFADVATWTKADIERRSHILADAAMDIWPYFGDSQSRPSDPIDVTGTTPTGLSILGQHISVQTWRDVLEQTMNTIAELEPEKFEQITQQFPRLVGADQKKLRAIRELKNGFFVEMNLSAKAIQVYCIQAIESIELTADDWQVTTADRTGTSNLDPPLTVFSGPSVEGKALGQQKNGLAEHEQGEMNSLRRDFWENLLARAEEKGFALHGGISPSAANWIGTQKLGIQFNYTVWLKEKTAVEVYIGTGDVQRNKSIFDHLYSHMAEIEGGFGESLEWERRDEGQGSRIRYKVYKGGLNNRDDWPQIVDATIDAMECLYEAVNPFLVYSQ